jgi:hypothetical protein
MRQGSNKGGRPSVREWKVGDRVPLGLRVSLDLKRSLDAAAMNTGRSQSQEAEARLETSFLLQHLGDQIFDLTYRDPHLAALLLTLGEAMRDTIDDITSLTREQTERPELGDWIDDPHIFNQVADAIQTVLEGFRPAGNPTPAQPPSINGKIVTGRAIAGGILSRVIGEWSDHYPWPQIRRRIHHGVIDRLSRQWKKVVGPTTRVVMHSEDLDRVSKKQRARKLKGEQA